MRTRFYFAGLIILLSTFSFSIYSQQTGAARRPATSAANASAPAGTRSSANSRVNSAIVKSDVSEALSVIQDNYIDGKKLDYNAIFNLNQRHVEFADPHSTYLDAADFAAFKTEQRSQYYGIGATIGDLSQGDQVNTYIRATFEEAPAARAGLRFGDNIVAVDGQSMKGKTFPEVRKFLLGALGTVVKVTVERAEPGRLKRSLSLAMLFRCHRFRRPTW